MNQPIVRDTRRLSKNRFDLFIIGGGISGACLAWDASLRGLKVALVDKGDFGSATSSATSKLIHGGLRYLKNGEINLVRESLAERRVLQAIAPHLVWPLPFMIPTYTKGNVKWMIKAGMLAYDILSFDRNKQMDQEHHMPSHKGLSPNEVRKLEPGVSDKNLTGGAIYYDAQCVPERITYEFVLGAELLGAVCENYVQAVSVTRRDARGVELELKDLVTGEKLGAEAGMVANMAGPWADEVDHLFGTGEDVALVRSKGIHIVTRSVTNGHSLVLRTDEGRHLFIMPWRGKSLIGTTDVRYEGEVGKLAVTDDDIEDFLDEINAALPSARLTKDDVTYSYAGVRPLVEQETQVYKASRKYEIVDHHARGHRGLISAVGGKFTTSRHLAEKLTDRILTYLNRPSVQCITKKRLLPGAPPVSVSDYVREHMQKPQLGDLSPQSLKHLIETYGVRHGLVLDMIKKDPSLAEPISEGRPEVLAEVAFSVEYEQAVTLCDVMVRRTGLATLGAPITGAMDKIVSLAAKRLGWKDERTARELEQVETRIHGGSENPSFSSLDTPQK